MRQEHTDGSVRPSAGTGLGKFYEMSGGNLAARSVSPLALVGQKPTPKL